MLYQFAKGLFTVFFRVFNHLVIKGKENRIEDGAFILYANHYSNLDPLLLPLIYKRQIFFMAKKELFSYPIIKQVVKAYGAFPVDRQNLDITAIKTSLKTLKNGNILGIFPEGTRVRDVDKSEPKGGFILMAYKSKVPLQPVRIKYKRKFHLFNRIEIIIEKPLHTEDLGVVEKTPDEYAAISKNLLNDLYSI